MAELTVKSRIPGKLIVYNEGVLKFENVRFSYPHLDRPYAGKNKNGGTNQAKYSIRGMLAKEKNEDVKKAVVEFMNGLLRDNKIERMAPKDKFFRDGDNEKAVEYEGHWVISTSELKRPTVRNRRGELITDPTEISDLIDGGYWGHILCRPWVQNNEHGQKLNANLLGVQHVRDDETFGEGRIDDTSAWGNEEEGGSTSGGGKGLDDDDGL